VLASAAELARREGRLTDALGLAGEALLSLRDSPQGVNCARCYAAVARVMVDAGRPADGVRFAAAADAHPLLESWAGPDDREAHERAMAAARGALGDEAFAAAWEDGRTMLLDEALRASRLVAEL
jgi:hypothetical protein